MRVCSDNVAPVLTWAVSGSSLLAASGKPTWTLTSNEATSANPLASAISYSSAMTFSSAISALAGNRWTISATHTAGNSAAAGTAITASIAAGGALDLAGNANVFSESLSSPIIYGSLRTHCLPLICRLSRQRLADSESLCCLPPVYFKQSSMVHHCKRGDSNAFHCWLVVHIQLRHWLGCHIHQLKRLRL